MYRIPIKTLHRNNINPVEHYFSLQTNLNYSLIDYQSNSLFYKQRFTYLLKSDLVNSISIDTNTYNTELDKDSVFSFVQTVPFTTFFKSNSIDVPKCFSKSYSLTRQQNKTQILKLVNYIMVHGNKQKPLNTLMSVLDSFNFNINNPMTQLSWKSIFVFFTYNLTHERPKNSFFIKNPDQGDDESLFYGLSDFTTKNTYNNFLFKKLKQLEPIFLFYIYKVDKSIFKNSRGRSGKFTFIWKYITPYKRSLIIYHWLVKELKIVNKKTLEDRLNFLIRQVIFDRNNTWIYKIRKFSYNYVYYNCRYTLARNYRTTTR